VETGNIVNKTGSSMFLKWLPAICLLAGIAGAWGTAQYKQGGLQAEVDEDRKNIAEVKSEVRALQQNSATKSDVKESTERIIRELDQIQKRLDEQRIRR
jgi:hypothetical protein